MKIDEIFEDSRGKIFVFIIEEREYLLFFTKKGSSRGGHLHDNREYGVVLKGIVERRYIYNGKESVENFSEGELQIVPPGAPHLMKALTDSWVLEWHEYPKTRKTYEPYRRIVEGELNEKN